MKKKYRKSSTSKIVSFRLSNSDYDLLKNFADEANISMGSYVRLCALTSEHDIKFEIPSANYQKELALITKIVATKFGKEASELSKVVTQNRRIGTNINDVVRSYLSDRKQEKQANYDDVVRRLNFKLDNLKMMNQKKLSHIDKEATKSWQEMQSLTPTMKKPHWTTL